MARARVLASGLLDIPSLANYLGGGCPLRPTGTESAPNTHEEAAGRDGVARERSLPPIPQRSLRFSQEMMDSYGIVPEPHAVRFPQVGEVTEAVMRSRSRMGRS